MLPSMSMDTNVFASSMSSALVSFASRARFQAFSSAITRPPSSLMLLCCAAVKPATNSSITTARKLFLTFFLRTASQNSQSHLSSVAQRLSKRRYYVQRLLLLSLAHVLLKIMESFSRVAYCFSRIVTALLLLTLASGGAEAAARAPTLAELLALLGCHPPPALVYALVYAPPHIGALTAMTTQASEQNPAESQQSDSLPEGNLPPPEQRRQQPVPEMHDKFAANPDEDHYS